MRLITLFYLSGLVHVTFALAIGSSIFCNTGLSGPERKRGLDGLGILPGLQGTSHAHTPIQTAPVLASLLDVSTSTNLTTTKKTTIKTSDFIFTGTAYSVIGTLPPLQTSSSWSGGTSAPVMPTPTSPSNSTISTSKSSNTSPTSGTSEWKIIGVAVIIFSAVAAILLLSVFFDHWWRFVRDIIWRKRKKENEEELVPDWEKAEWQLQLARGSQRYPSFGSLPSSLPSVPVVQAQTQGRSPPQAALGRSVSRRDAPAAGPAVHIDRSLLRTPSASKSPEPTVGYAGVGVGLGLERAGSVNRGEHAVSPYPGGHAGRTFPLQLSPRRGQGNAMGANSNPFDDVHSQSPVPDDVYAGMADVLSTSVAVFLAHCYLTIVL